MTTTATPSVSSPDDSPLTAGSTTLAEEGSPLPEGTSPRRRHTALAAVGALSVLAVIGGLLLPDRTVGAGMDGMSMTHYMGLLAVNQPWNLLLFMAAPVILAETLAITELALLFKPASPRWVHGLSHWAGILVGPLMLGILVHLLRYAVVPLTVNGGWRGPADVIAVLSYLAGGIPMIGISLVEAGVLGRDERSARKLHVLFVAIFLVVAHVAMILGMLDPTVLGWHQPAAPAGDMSNMPGMNMPNMPNMPGMTHAPTGGATPMPSMPSGMHSMPGGMHTMPDGSVMPGGGGPTTLPGH